MYLQLKYIPDKYKKINITRKSFQTGFKTRTRQVPEHDDDAIRISHTLTLPSYSWKKWETDMDGEMTE